MEEIFSSRYWKNIYKTGMTKIPRRTPLNIPIAALILIDLFPEAIPPAESIKGIIPAINANEVIIMGRNLAFAPSKADSIMDNPDYLF